MKIKCQQFSTDIYSLRKKSFGVNYNYWPLSLMFFFTHPAIVIITTSTTNCINFSRV